MPRDRVAYRAEYCAMVGPCHMTTRHVSWRRRSSEVCGVKGRVGFRMSYRRTWLGLAVKCGIPVQDCRWWWQQDGGYACLHVYTERFHSTGEVSMLQMHVMEYHNNKATLPQVIKGTMDFDIILCLQSAAHFCRPARADLRCDCRVRSSGGQVRAGFGSRALLLAGHISSTSPARPKGDIVISSATQDAQQKFHHRLPVPLPLSK